MVELLIISENRQRTFLQNYTRKKVAFLILRNIVCDPAVIEQEDASVIPQGLSATS